METKKGFSAKSVRTPKIFWALVIGFALGVIWLMSVRFVTYRSDNVHYHANFELYINNHRDEFDSFTFYEEVQACGSDKKNNPRNRVHMHNHEGHVAHVHEPGMTWGYFFANLGYTLGDSLIKTDDGTYIDGQNGQELTFMLNGREVENVANEIIRSEDVLLINYGSDNEATLKQRYENIPKDAGEYNKRNDPGTCAGDEELTFWSRLKKSAGF